MNPVIMLNERWQLTDDGELQWLLQYRKGHRWHNKGYITSKAGLLEVGLPHHRISAPAPVFDALNALPEIYRPGVLNTVSERLALSRAA